MSDQYARGPLDQKIIHALQIDGRASFSRISHVVGVSPQTVSRRYSHLHGSAELRVLGLTRSDALNEEEWFLRIQCTPDTASSLANAMALHHETTWVHLTSSGTETFCLIRTAPGGESALLNNLQKKPGVKGITAHCLLHTYYGREFSTINKTGPLTSEQVAHLRPGSAELTRPVDLSPADRKMLSVLRLDGRATYQNLAHATGWSQSTVQRRMTELRQHGLLYLDVDYDARVIGYGKLVMLWLSVAPAVLDTAGEALAQHNEIAFAASTTGSTNLYAVITCADTRALHQYLTGPVAAIPGVAQIETAPIVKTLKRAGVFTA